MTAPDLSPAEAVIVARFDAAPTPPEVLREQLARVMWEAVRDDTPWPLLTDASQERWRRAADAALAVFRDQQDPVVQRVLVLAESWRYKGEYGWGAWQEGHGPDPEGYILDRAAADIRAAIGGAE